MEMVLSMEDGWLQALQPERCGQKWHNAGRSGGGTWQRVPPAQHPILGREVAQGEPKAASSHP
jgi:hypothetical protein